MRSVEITGKTVDEAITSALLQLGASSDQVDIEIVDEGGRGLLGLFHKSAKIRATLKEGEEAVVETAESKMAAAKAAVEEKKEEVKEAVKEAAPVKEQKPAKEAVREAEKKEEAPAEDKPYNFEKYEATTTTGETVTIDDSIEQRIRRANAERDARGSEGRGKKEERSSRRSRGGRFQERNRREEIPEEELPEKEPKIIEPKVYEIPADAEDVKAKVIDFLTGVLKAMGIETTVTAAFSEEGILEVNIEGEGMGVIIGKRGATLDSLQYLATLVVNKGRADHVRMKLDTEGYRARRQETLEKLAINLAKKAKRTGRRVALEPMNPYERRIIHSVLQADRGVETYSEGEEPYRKVVITPRKRR
jgi:spoIIIJ-associated protein